jgi:hypothetical protein
MLARRYGRSQGGPMTSFRAAARKIEKMIAEVEAGQTDTGSDDTKVFNAINRLEDKAYKDWRKSGDDEAKKESESIAKALRERMRSAVDIGFQARQARRSGEIKAIKEAEFDRIANMTYDQRALYQYQQELKLRR